MRKKEEKLIDEIAKILSGKEIAERFYNGLMNNKEIHEQFESKDLLKINIVNDNSKTGLISLTVEFYKTEAEFKKLIFNLDLGNILKDIEKGKDIKLLRRYTVEVIDPFYFDYLENVNNVFKTVLGYVIKVLKKYRGIPISGLMRLLTSKCDFIMADKKVRLNGMVSHKEEFYLKIDSTKSDIKTVGGYFRLDEVIKKLNDDSNDYRLIPVEDVKKDLNEEKVKIIQQEEK